MKCEYSPDSSMLREETEELIILFLRDRIIFVTVASGALEGQAEERRREGVGPVGDVLDAELLLDAASLVGLAVVAVERRGEDLGAGGRREQVAGQLPGDEPVVRQIVVERPDDPVAPRPHGAIDVGLVSVRVGVSGQVEPVDGHPLAEPRRGQQPVDQPLIGAGTRDRPGRRRSPRGSAASRSGHRSRGGSAAPCRPPGRATDARPRGAPGRTGRSGCGTRPCP